MTKDFFDELDNELTSANIAKSEDTSSQNVSLQTSEVSSQKEEAKPQKKQRPQPPRGKNFKKQQRPFGQKVERSSVDEESTVEDENENDFDMIKYSNDENYNFQKNILANFPQTKFYMPTLRDGYTRVIPIG